MATTGEDAGWNWKYVELGSMEYCPCSCSLTRGELKALELSVYENHSEAAIAQARARLDQKYNVIGRRYI